MFARLFLLFTVVPLLDLFVLVKVGQRIGATYAILLVLFTGAVGAWMARQQGFFVLQRIQQDMAQGVPPAGQLLDGALILVGGVLLVTPGFLTDGAGFFLLVPPTRALARRWLADWAGKRIRVQHGVIDV